MAVLTLALLALVALCMLFGSVDIDAKSVVDILLGRGSDNTAWEVIVLQSRLPMVIVAMLAGAALSVSGLLLQTTFNNPLAGPSILGVSSGAGLGVAVVIEASHTCMTLRGVQKANAMTTTSAFSGIFLRDERTRNEFLNLIK